MQVRDKATFRNGEIVTIKNIKTNQKDFTTIDAGMNTITVKAGEHTTFIVQFSDGEITIASENELTPLDCC